MVFIGLNLYTERRSDNQPANQPSTSEQCYDFNVLMRSVYSSPLNICSRAHDALDNVVTQLTILAACYRSDEEKRMYRS